MDFAFAMGFPSADHFLKAISVSQWMEWMEWVNIRGPIGAVRQDLYTSFVAMHAGSPYQKPVTLDDFPMPWTKPEAELEEDED